MSSFRLGDLDLGGFDAESDYKLREHFVMTPYAREALSGRRTLFLGRKGSGKSALFRELPGLLRDEGWRGATVPITPDAYAWETIQQYEERGYSAEAAHRSAWELTLAVQLASRLVQLGGKGETKVTERARHRLARFLDDNYGGREVDFRGATRILRNLRSVKLSALGAGLELVRHDVDGPSIAPGLADRLLDLIGECTEAVPAVVLLDRLDEEWDGSERAQQLLVGLLMAAKEINDRFLASPGHRRVRVLVFLRSDIYDALRYDDKDKHRSSEQHLIWTHETLRKLVSRRLPEGVTIEDLFPGGSPHPDVDPFTYLVDRTFLRPRELLQFVFECGQRAGAGSAAISAADILEAEMQFSRWKLEDLKQEYAKSRPELSPLLDTLHMQVDRFGSIGELEAALSTSPLIDARAGMRRLVDILFETSVIGVQTGDRPPPRYKCADPAAVLPGRGTVFIHPALHKSLQVLERPDDDKGVSFGVRTRALDTAAVVIAVAGELDLFTIPELSSQIATALGAGVTRVFVDLTNCRFLDSTALGVLQSGAMGLLRQHDHSLDVIMPDTHARRIFSITGLDRVIALHNSVAAALRTKPFVPEGWSEGRWH